MFDYLHIFFLCSVFTLSSFLTELFLAMSLAFSVLAFPASSFRSCRWFDLVVLELIFDLVGVGVLYVFNVAKMLKAKVRKMSSATSKTINCNYRGPGVFVKTYLCREVL